MCGKQARKLRYISNAILVSDAVTRPKRAIRTINESVIVGSDSIYHRLFAFRRLNELVTVSDSIQKHARKLRFINELAINTTDSVPPILLIIIRIVDTVCTSASTGGGTISRAVHRIFGQDQASGF